MNNDPNSYTDRREKWVHEDDLLNHRMNWLLASQGLMFAGYAVIIKLEADVPNCEDMAGRVKSFIGTATRWLPWLGISTCLVVLSGVVGACLAMWKLREPTEKPYVGTLASTLGIVPSLFLPILFLLAWVLMMRSV